MSKITKKQKKLQELLADYNVKPDDLRGIGIGCPGAVTGETGIVDILPNLGWHNVHIVDHVGEDTMKGLPVPDVTMLVASASMEQEMKFMLSINPDMEFVIYTLDFVVAASMQKLCKELGMADAEIIQVAVSKLSSRNTYNQQPSPWIITCRPEE